MWHTLRGLGSACVCVRVSPKEGGMESPLTPRCWGCHDASVSEERGLPMALAACSPSDSLSAVTRETHESPSMSAEVFFLRRRI